MFTTTTQCIVPPLAADKTGYHKATLNGKTVLKHRLEYCKHNGVKLVDIHGKYILHKCDNRGCINPEHLVLGTQQDNMQDMHDKGRANHTNNVRGTKVNTAKLTDDDVRVILTNKPYRTTSQLAVAYGVSYHSMAMLQKGKTWKHIHKELDTTQQYLLT